MVIIAHLTLVHTYHVCRVPVLDEYACTSCVLYVWISTIWCTWRSQFDEVQAWHDCVQCVWYVCGVILILMIHPAMEETQITYGLWHCKAVFLNPCLNGYISHIPGILHVVLQRKRSQSSASAGETPAKKKTMDEVVKMKTDVESSVQGKCRRRIWKTMRYSIGRINHWAL